MSVSKREKKDLAKGKKSGQRGENVTPRLFSRHYIRLLVVNNEIIVLVSGRSVNYCRCWPQPL
jgi:hypothetical protein